MSRTVEIKAFTYDELSEKAKEKARQWYREASDSDGNHEAVFEDFEVIAGFMGFEIDANTRTAKSGRTIREPKIYYSGFWSQGDGACFSGIWRARDVRIGELLGYATDATLTRIGEAFREIAKSYPELWFRVKHSGHYYHRFCTDFEFEWPDEMQDSDVSAVEEELTDLSRDLMLWLYRALEKEYECQNSDEVVAETIEINEYEFLEDGSRFRY